MASGTFFEIFGWSFMTALTGALVPGPLLIYTIMETVKSKKHGYLVGLLIIIGHALLELIIIFLLLRGLSELIQTRTAELSIGIIGSILLILMGVDLMIKLYKKTSNVKYFDINLLKKNGIVLNQRKGTPLIVLKGPLVSYSQGGDMDLEYLYNYITGSRKSLKLQIRPIDGKWQLLTKDDNSNPEKISLLSIKAKKVLGITIGIKEILINK